MFIVLFRTAYINPIHKWKSKVKYLFNCCQRTASIHEVIRSCWRCVRKLSADLCPNTNADRLLILIGLGSMLFSSVEVKNKCMVIKGFERLLLFMDRSASSVTI